MFLLYKCTGTYMLQVAISSFIIERFNPIQEYTYVLLLYAPNPMYKRRAKQNLRK